MKHIDDMAEVAEIDLRLEPFDWPFAGEEAARVDEHWAELRREKPALFDGRVLLTHRVDIELEGRGRLAAGAFETGYKSFLGWRDFGCPGVPVANLFSMTALRSADGAFMLGRMSQGTANAGRLYFPAGTPEPKDAGSDGRVDLAGNMIRELKEETGIRPDEVELDPTWTVVFDGPRIACMRVARSAHDAVELTRRAAAFIAAEPHPELDVLLPVRSPADFDSAAMPRFMIRYLTVALARS